MRETIKISRYLSRQTALTALVYFLPLALLISIILWSFYHRETMLAGNRLEQQAINTVTLQKAKIGGNFKLIVADLLFLSNYNQLLDMLEDPRTYKGRLTEDLLLFSRGRKLYDQIRVLDSTGMEVIRINFSGDNAVRVPENELQFKGSRYYFKDTTALQKGEIFISPFDLNIEHGAIELPRKPMIRFGTPIFDRHGRRRGVVIFNYLGANLIRDMKEAFAGSPGHAMLLNTEGYWLVGRDAGEEWGFMYADGKGKTLQKSFPGAWNAVSASDTGQINNGDGLFTFDTVYPLIQGWKSTGRSGKAFAPSISEKTAREYSWKIVSFIPSDYLKVGDLLVFNKYILINAIVIVLLAAGSWVMAGARLARREADKSLRQSHDELERAVTLRTFDLDKANQELRQSEERLRSVIEQSPVGIAFSRDGITLDANKVYLGMFGYADSEELRGKPLVDQIAPQYRTEILDRIRRRAQGEAVDTSYESIGLRKDGSQFPFFVSASRVVMSDGPMTISFFIDISERKRAEQLRQEMSGRIAMILDSVTDAFVALDTNWYYTYVNKKAAEIFGRKPEDMIGKHIWTEFPEGVGQPFYQAYYKAAEEQRFIYLEEYYTPYDRWFENRIYPSKDGLAIFFNDITDRKKLEMELVKHREHLEELVNDRTTELQNSRQALMNIVEDLDMKTKELEVANSKLKDLDHLKSLFIASMSHELRTPLNSIIGFTGILLQGLAGELNTEQRKQLGMVKSSSEHLLSLITDIIDLSKIEVGKIDLSMEAFDLSGVVHEVLGSFQVMAGRKSLLMSADMPPGLMVVSDKRRIRQVLVNLIGNSMKFTEHGGVSVTAHQKDGIIKVSVRDTGMGIKLEDQDKLFKSFSQVTTMEIPKHEGTGLGLYLSRRLVTLLGGEIGVESELGKGSAFFFTLPMKQR